MHVCRSHYAVNHAIYIYVCVCVCVFPLYLCVIILLHRGNDILIAVSNGCGVPSLSDRCTVRHLACIEFVIALLGIGFISRIFLSTNFYIYTYFAQCLLKA